MDNTEKAMLSFAKTRGSEAEWDEVISGVNWGSSSSGCLAESPRAPPRDRKAMALKLLLSWGMQNMRPYTAMSTHITRVLLCTPLNIQCTGRETLEQIGMQSHE